MKAWINENYTKSDVCLVLMPMAPLERPSIGLGLLNAQLKSANISSSVIYGNLLFAELAGNREFAFADNYPAEDMLGEWIFSKALFPDFKGNSLESYFELVLPGSTEHEQTTHEAHRREAFVSLRENANIFIEGLAQSIALTQPKVVGCSSIFQQTTASLALLKRIKQLSPETATILGGFNCDGIFGKTIIQNFEFLDFAVSGEADELIVPLIRLVFEKGGKISQSELPNGVLGYEYRNPDSQFFNLHENKIPRAMAKNINQLPIPDYTDFDKTIQNLTISKDLNVGYLVETARGCWWGDKHKCSFCGLNAEGLYFRSKDPAIALAQFAEISETYNTKNLEAVDNIVDMTYLTTVMPKLAEMNKPYNLFYEIKANLKPAHFKMLFDAGIRWTQPGLESLNNNVLKLMNKGTNVLTNIQHLKLARKYGIHTSWSILSCFPGEKVEWYEDMASIIPLLAHLPPPMQIMLPVRFTRTSYYFENRNKLNLNMQPFLSAKHVYPFADDVLNNLLIFFTDKDHFKSFDDEVYSKVNDSIQKWMSDYSTIFRPILSFNKTNDNTIEVIDMRPEAIKKFTNLSGTEANVFEIINEIKSKSAIIRILNETKGILISIEHLTTILSKFKDLKLIVESDEKVLGLAIEGSCNAEPDEKTFPGGINNINHKSFKYYWGNNSI